ncbi:hypothetical protein PGTUg99_024303 [Puccinia graminis f. sp. tritici]|uniref:CxC1-like cysteine cluster associated with KDZ transposases domain-containing protein n=2 Tax=Puccinia graminis f. sp. tritici TaxID=56615 RepID=A0A5B0RVA2_PUCGR|nr:hypothetical protein PGTUg99_024303 [Puccinia graminis f. sp. tritici]
MWKHSAVPISPFSRAVDEFLDAHNPLILVPSNNNESDYAFTPRQWRRTLSSAVDAFREMLRREELLSESLLSMNPIDKMADICPPCYGPQVPGTRADEPNYIVCMDGNFQHRRHEAASVKVPGMLKTPSLFIKPDEVAQMELSMNPALHNAIEGDVNRHLQQLPDTLVMLEGEIESILDELGTDYFQNLQGGSEAEIKALIKIKISKSKLYEAKVGVIEMQKRWDQPRSGTRVQHPFKKQMNSKMNMFKKKWISYNNRATSFNSDFSPEVPLETPSFDDVKAFGIDNFFWSTSRLDHPSEPWAVDVNTQKGIQAYLTVTHCQDELRRIAREARQTVTWAIEKSIKMDQLLQSLQAEPQETDVLTESQQQVKNTCSEFNCPKAVVQQTWERLVSGQSVVMEFDSEEDQHEEEIFAQEQDFIIHEQN